MKYTVDKGKLGKQNVLILTEKMFISPEGRIIEGKLGNQLTSARYDVCIEYESFEESEDVVNLIVYKIKKGKPRKKVIIDNMNLNIMKLLRINDDVFPYLIKLLNSSYNGCPKELYKELADYNDTEIQKGSRQYSRDKRTLKVMEELLREENCNICKLGYSGYPAGEVITAPLKTYEELGIHIK